MPILHWLTKKNFYELVEHVPVAEIDEEIREKVDRDRGCRRGLNTSMTPAGVRREQDGGTVGGSPAGDVGRASTSPKVLTSIGTVLATLLVSRPHSTADQPRRR